jgi:hypothetical protein
MLSLCLAAAARADCGGPFEETFDTRVSACQRIVPGDDTRLRGRVARLPAGVRAEVLEQYRGSELATDGGPLFVPEASGLACAGIPRGRRVRITAGLACCDGDPNPPCYLGYSRYVKAIGE